MYAPRRDGLAQAKGLEGLGEAERQFPHGFFLAFWDWLLGCAVACCVGAGRFGGWVRGGRRGSSRQQGTIAHTSRRAEAPAAPSPSPNVAKRPPAWPRPARVRCVWIDRWVALWMADWRGRRTSRGLGGGGGVCLADRSSQERGARESSSSTGLRGDDDPNGAVVDLAFCLTRRLQLLGQGAPPAPRLLC